MDSAMWARLATVVGFMAALMCGCSGQANKTPGVSPGPAGSPYHKVRSPEEFPAILGAAADQIEVGEYANILAKLRAAGLEALSSDELEGVLYLSHVAFLAQAETIRYRGHVVDPSGSSPPVDFVAEEIYVVEKQGDVIQPRLLARHWLGRGISWPVQRLPLLNPQAAYETLESYSFQNDPALEFGVVTLTLWERRGEGWTCRSGKDTFDYGLGSMARFYMIGCLVSDSVPQGIGTVDGRPAYELGTRCLGSEGSDNSPQRYWLDEETLLPRQWEYEDASNTITVTVEEVNGTVDTQPPDVDITCEEKDFDP